MQKNSVGSLQSLHAEQQRRIPSVPLKLSIDAQQNNHEELVQPPSPVSSSYSELRRATENPYPSMPVYPSTSQHSGHTYANVYQSDYTYASYQPSSLRPVYRYVQL